MNQTHPMIRMKKMGAATLTFLLEKSLSSSLTQAVAANQAIGRLSKTLNRIETHFAWMMPVNRFKLSDLSDKLING